MNIIDPDLNTEIFLYLYNRLVKTGSLKSMYWEQENAECLGFRQFLTMYVAGSGQNIILLSHKDDIIGYATLYNRHSNYRCFAGIWIDPRWRGGNSVNVMTQAMTYVHGTLGIKFIYAMVISEAAKSLVSKVGMRSITEIPGYVPESAHDKSVEMFYSEVDVWKYNVANKLIALGYQPNSAAQMVAGLFKEE